MSNLKLRDVMWELTPRCNKNCEYCGSSDVMNKQKELSKETYDSIVEKIIAYPPEELTLTGGEPTICSCFDEVVDKLSSKMRVKVVSNGTIFSKDTSILNKISQIGYSVNTELEMENFNNNILPTWKDMFLIELPKKITMITNFGIHNIWSFDSLFKFFIQSEFSVWQIQLTMGKYQLNDTGLDHLKSKIAGYNDGRFETLFSPSIAKGTRSNKCLIVLSDNLQEEHTCNAGMNSCSITYDGLVIPCLSERSWRKELRVNGDLKSDTLENIWEHSFRDQRFKGICESCRECIKYPNKVYIKEVGKDVLKESHLPPISIPRRNDTSGEPYRETPYEISMYNVSSPSQATYIYAVWNYTQGTNSSNATSSSAIAPNNIPTGTRGEGQQESGPSSPTV